MNVNSIIKSFKNGEIYKQSIREFKNTLFFIIKEEKEKKLVVYGREDFIDTFYGICNEEDDGVLKICKLSKENCKALQKLFPFMLPQSHKENKFTIGLGDRLGNASAAHLRLLSKIDAFPVIAQQSIRELTLTGRNYEDVLCDAAWAIFQEGYTDGFGADGDHLKTADEIKMALDEGFTMITLDCSEHINNEVDNMKEDEIENQYNLLIGNKKDALEKEYVTTKHLVNNKIEIEISLYDFKKIIVQYFEAIKHTENIYNSYIKHNEYHVDFEVSIDETLTSTSPEAHFVIATELNKKDIEVSSMAPRFCGEFQKGIDYIGDKIEFKKEFEIHAEIAKHFGYKISVHSGSDKLSIYNIIWKKTDGKLHLKTAGTNWLEAVRLIADKEPNLYREMHKFAIQNIDEAKKYYHVKADTNLIPDIDNIKDTDLKTFLDMDDSRQTLHITYGLLLNAKDEKGNYLFKDKFMKALYEYEDEYYQYLIEHIGRHIEKLEEKYNRK